MTSVKELISLALQENGTFHWHLAKDKGWRIDIINCPKLTTQSMNSHRIAFWTFSNSWKNVPADFGCAVHGFANSRQWANPQEPLTGVWDESLRGTLASGNYDSVLKTLSVLSFKPKVGIVLFSKPTGIESFIDRLIQIMPGVPLIGGGAAIADGQAEGELMPPGEDVALLPVEKGNFKLESLNIFDKIDLSIEIKKTSSSDFQQLKVLPDGD
jgi:hypothetical protein